MDLRGLWRRLAERNARPGRAAAIDRSLWRRTGRSAAILISDMSGFTRITKRHGILHFLAMHEQSVELATPVIRRGGGTVVKTEADNMISVFANPDRALRAALGIQEAARRRNAGVDADSAILLCMGVGYGRIIRLTDDVFGDEVNVAYKLGEDVARAGEILVSQGARRAVRSRAFRFSAVKSARSGNVGLRYYRLLP